MNIPGYQIADIWRNIGSEYEAFVNDNINPLIDTYRRLHGANSNTLPVTP
jgi:hypothetical protein